MGLFGSAIHRQKPNRILPISWWRKLLHLTACQIFLKQFRKTMMNKVYPPRKATLFFFLLCLHHRRNERYVNAVVQCYCCILMQIYSTQALNLPIQYVICVTPHQYYTSKSKSWKDRKWKSECRKKGKFRWFCFYIHSLHRQIKVKEKKLLPNQLTHRETTIKVERKFSTNESFWWLISQQFNVQQVLKAFPCQFSIVITFSF